MPHGRHIAVTSNQAASEQVEVIDLDGNVIEIVSRQRMREEKLRHRSVFIAVINDDGDLLVHRRAEHKDVWPGWWDVAVGGVVGVSEDYDTAAWRELREELGIDAAKIESIGTGAYVDEAVKLVASCYVVYDNGPFQFTDDEITEAHWVTAGELDIWLSAKPFLPDSIALVLPRLRQFARIVV
jgi:isopentenyldiphosphate isomerase